jgi:hypothetical protein
MLSLQEEVSRYESKDTVPAKLSESFTFQPIGFEAFCVRRLSYKQVPIAHAAMTSIDCRV